MFFLNFYGGGDRPLDSRPDKREREREREFPGIRPVQPPAGKVCMPIWYSLLLVLILCTAPDFAQQYQFSPAN